jgi:drug/metabolite transporter (DMT)-like permease
MCAFGSSVTWAIGSTVYSRLSKQYSAFSVNFARGLIALPLFILAAFVVSGGWSEGITNYQLVRASHWGWFTLSMIASYGMGDVLFLWSTRSLGVPGSLAIASCYPIWTLLIGYFFFDEKVSLLQGFGLVMTILGVIIVVLNGPKTDQATQRFSWVGLFLAVATSVAWATNSFATSRGGVDLSPPVGNTIRMIMALILSATFGRIFAAKSPILLPKRQFYQSLWVFVLEAFGGSYFYIYGLSHSPLALGSTLASLAPVISVPVALVLGLEKFSIFRTLGVILAVLGIWFLLGTF